MSRVVSPSEIGVWTEEGRRRLERKQRIGSYRAMYSSRAVKLKPSAEVKPWNDGEGVSCNGKAATQQRIAIAANFAKDADIPKVRN